MRTYKIFDMRKGLLAPDTIIRAKSPLEAVKIAYPNADVNRHTFEFAKRTRIWNANVIVNGSYAYVVRER